MSIAETAVADPWHMEPAQRKWAEDYRQETLVLLLALALSYAHMMIVARDIPFWIDETYSGVIASQATLIGWFNWCRNEASGPVYYGILWIWEKLAGSSNAALRLPSYALVVAAPLYVIRFSPQSRPLVFVWAALIALSSHALMSAPQARPYALLYFLACVQAVAFLNLARTPTLGCAFAWTTVSSLLALTHLHAGLIVGVQGIILVVLLRNQIRRLLPAALTFLAVPAWLFFQWPFLAKLAGANQYWYPPISPNVYLMFSDTLFGPGLPSLIVMTAMFAIFGHVALRRVRGNPTGLAREDMLLAVSGLVAILVALLIAYRMPTFALRYAIPYLPAAYLAIALSVQVAARRYRLAPLIGVGLAASPAFHYLVAFHTPHAADRFFALEAQHASEWLIEQKARHVIFAWDNPVTRLNDPQRLREVGGFFFDRADYPVTIESVLVPPGSAARDPLVRLAREKRAAILWIGGSEYPTGFEAQLGTSCMTRSFDDGHSVACKAPRL
jgi:hypothetical protein